MKKYIIVLSDEAVLDIDAITDYIHSELKAPITARRYHDGLIRAIMKLSAYGGTIAISRYEFIQHNYGPNARHITYKKMTVIYLIDGDFVYVQRIIPGSSIL
jgi:plasmid stabilization system protein ParE